MGKVHNFLQQWKSMWFGCDVIANGIFKRNIRINAIPESQEQRMTVFPGF